MKPAPFSYHDPRTLSDAIELLGGLDNVKLLAGGQSLVPMLNMRFVIVDHIVDLNRIDGLDYIREQNGALHIGAMARQRTLERDSMVARCAPILREALGHVGHLQTRSRGTIGGSLCHLDPAAEIPGIALLYDAKLHIAGQRGRRDVPASEWCLSYMTSVLEPDEILIGIVLPYWPEPHGYAFVEFARRDGDFAIVGVACLLAFDQAGNICRAAIALIGAAITPIRLTAAEAALMGQPATPKTFRAAAEYARAVECLGDALVSAAYRQRLAVVLVERALTLAAERTRRSSDVPH